jgi:hypothetical protein
MSTHDDLFRTVSTTLSPRNTNAPDSRLEASPN